MSLNTAYSLGQRLKWAGISLLFLTLTAAAVWGVYKIPGPLVEKMLETDIRHEAELWKRRVVLHMEDPQQSFLTGRFDPHDEEFLNAIPEASNVYRYKLFNTQGTVFWSTREHEVGEVENQAFFRNDLAQGMIHYVHEIRPLSEIDGLDLHVENTSSVEQRHVAQVYMPVMENGRFIGAIEFFTDFTEMRATFVSRVRISLAILSTIALLAMATVSFVIFRTNRRQFHALHDRTEKERRLLSDQLRLAREVQLLGELNEWLQSSRSLEELFDMVSRFMTHILPTAEGSVYVYSNSRDVLDGSASWNGGDHKAHIHPEGCWGLRRGRTYEYGTSEIDFVCEHAEPHDGRPYFCFPILAHGETVGLMHLRAQTENCEDFAESKKLAQMCAEQISMAIANVRMRDQLHDQSVRDPLTGLFNRRHLTDYLRKKVARSQNTGAELSLIAIDVDHFKKFNDTHGHDAGDMVLRAVGSVLEQSCDGEEIACRMGGEEFMIILPETAQDDVMTRAEHVRQAVEAISVRYGEKTLPRITISAGVSFFPTHGSMPQDLMRSADDALYDAKAKGRNQIQLARNAPIIVEDLNDDSPDQAQSKGGQKRSAPGGPTLAAE
jgi:diguanylate cyclase (GGDEF)-like protein